jgi:hypothetical protein
LQSSYLDDADKQRLTAACRQRFQQFDDGGGGESATVAPIDA